MLHAKRNDAGFALATAILALVVVGALVTAGFFAASQESRIGTSNAQADLAFYIAEQGVHNVLGNVTRATMQNVTAAQTVTRTGNVEVGDRLVGSYTATVRPFGNNLFWVESLGTVRPGSRYGDAQRRVGMVLRTMNVAFPMNGALTTFGGITLRGNATVSGTDTNPNGWGGECPTADSTEAGIYTTPDSEIVLQGSPNVDGDPAIERDPNLTPSDFEDFGELDFEDFQSIATWSLAATTVSPAPSYNGDGSCNTADPNNWGAPTAPTTDPCFNHFPLVYYSGDLEVRGNSVGQGILFVDGNFSIGGGFEFFGIVIVKGRFNNAGSGTAEIHGTLITGNNANIEDNSEYRGTPTLQFSTCSANRAVLNNDALSRLFPVQQRSWVDLTAAGVL